MTIEPKTAFRRYYQKAPFDRLLESKALDLPLNKTNETIWAEDKSIWDVEWYP